MAVLPPNPRLCTIRSWTPTPSRPRASTPIREDLALIDGAEDKASLVRVLGSLNPRDEIDLFGMGVYGDPADPDTNILHLVQGGIGLPDEAYYREDRYEPIRQAYVDMVSTLLRLAGYAEHHADSDAMAKRFLDVETRIAAHHWDNVAVRDPQKTYNMTSFDQLCAMLSMSTSRPGPTPGRRPMTPRPRARRSRWI